MKCSKRFLKSSCLAALTLLSGLLLTGCGLITAKIPSKVTRSSRLANIPLTGAGLENPLKIRFNEHQIPFIEAQSDEDAAFGVGVVHAHLRLGQMELFRRVSQARISEIAGPFAADIDHTLRILDPDKAIGDIEKTLPEESKRWLESYVKGINFFQARAKQKPLEYKLFNIQAETWTVKEVLAVARLAATEVNWLFWAQLLGLYKEAEFEEFYERVKLYGSDSRQSFGDVMKAVPLSGSNSFAISGKRSLSGSALIASDPHVGISAPNLWVMLGIKSPSYHSAGMSLPGLPLILIGRNPDIAWGATNMMAFSSSLYQLTSDDLKKAKERTETIKQRWWLSKDITIRDSAYGPVLSDSPFFADKKLPSFAIRWRGHEVSDEISPFLKLMKAKNWQNFQDAFNGYAVSAQNYLYADRKGNVGHLLAHEFPLTAGRTAADLISDPSKPENVWEEILGPKELPKSYNPKRGFVLSTNNKPVSTEPRMTFFAHSNARFDRISALLSKKPKLSLKELKGIQRDVRDPSSERIAKRIVELLNPESSVILRGEEERKLFEALSNWDGSYSSDSSGALAFQLIVNDFVRGYYGPKYGAKISNYLKSSQLTFYLLEQDLGERGTLAPLRIAFWAAVTPFSEFKTWGEFHRLEISHPLSNAPLIGKRFKFLDHPAEGSSATVQKTAHSLTDERHSTRYGANARILSDMSDLDSNYVVLLGGQDGWFGSENFVDQVDLWRSGELIQLPLRMETLAQLFKDELTIQ